MRRSECTQDQFHILHFTFYILHFTFYISSVSDSDYRTDLQEYVPSSDEDFKTTRHVEGLAYFTGVKEHIRGARLLVLITVFF